MVRRHVGQLELTQLVLFGVVREPEALMDPTLRHIDELLEDEALVDQVLEVLRGRHRHSARRGRPGTPAEVVLRMLVLKHLRGWSYDQLEWEVTGNVVYRRFCRIDGGKVPDAKTLVRLGQLLAGPVLEGLFRRVVELAIEKKVTRGRRMRIDTTVVEAPIRYPTDSGLCADVVRVISRALRRLVDAGVQLPFALRNVRRSVMRRLQEIGDAARRRGEQAREALRKPYQGLLRITGRLIRQAQQALDEGRAQQEELGEQEQRLVERTLQRLQAIVPLAQQVTRQTRERVLRGVTRSADKLISLFEPWAQILRRGKPRHPTEFGALVKVQESEGGIVTDIGHVTEKADAPLLVPALEHHIEVFGHAPRLAATDRGFYSTEGDRRAREMGVRQPVIPKPGFRSQARIQYERQRWFRQGRAWRAGGEARIARLKNTFGMSRCRYHGETGLPRSIHWAAIANNLCAVASRLR